MVKLIGVALLDVLRSYDKIYTYIAPKAVDNIDLDQLVGRLVSVPFGHHNGKKLGVILEVSNCLYQPGSMKLKEAEFVYMDLPKLSAQALSAAAYMRDRFYCSMGDALRCFFPAYITDKKLVTTESIAVFSYPDKDADLLIKDLRLRSLSAIKTLEALIQYGECPLEQLRLETGVSREHIRKFVSKGIIEIQDRPISATTTVTGTYKPLDLELIPEQKRAVSGIVDALDSGEHSVLLLHGVTGSGKTEVYMEAIAHCIKAGKGALVVVPEIALTPQYQRRFQAVFGDQVTVLHSAMSEGSRRERWLQVARGHVKIVLGPRSSLFAPVNNLGLIVVDEQHDGSYRSETTPKYDAMIMAEEMARLNNIPLVLGSATPSIEVYKRGMDGEIQLLEMPRRANNNPMPHVEVVDLRKDRGYPISDSLMAQIRENVKSGGKTMVLLNRRGFNTSVTCADCGRTLKCPSCGVRLNWHRQAGRLVCHYCGYTAARPDSCPSCDSHNLIQRGAAIQYVEEYIREQLQDVPVFRLDSDSVTYKNAREDILAGFRQSKAGVLIGTQMISKGHDFPDVTLVGILGIDSILQSEGYMGPEQAFQTMMQTAGRSGRGKLPGRVVIETSEPDNFCIRAVQSYDYKYFYSQETILRRQLNYPPFGQIASCCFVGPNDRETYDACLKFKQDVLAKYLPNVFVVGPARPVVPKQGGRYRWKLVLRKKDTDYPLYQELIALVDSMGMGDKGLVHMSLDFNPDSVIN